MSESGMTKIRELDIRLSALAAARKDAHPVHQLHLMAEIDKLLDLRLALRGDS